MPLSLTRIGLVFPYDRACCRSILRGVQAFAGTRPSWVLLPVGPGISCQPALRYLDLAGVLVANGMEFQASGLARLSVPVVAVCDAPSRLAFPRVGLDDRAVGRLAATHLLERGCRNFGFVAPHADRGHPEARGEGFRQALAAAGHADVAVFRGPAPAAGLGGSPHGRNAAMQDWVRSLPGPAGLFAHNDDVGWWLLEACNRAGLRVPEEVAVLAAGNDDFLCGSASPPLSSIALPGERLGHEAAALLDRLLRGEGPPPQPLLLGPLGVIARASSDREAVPDPEVGAAVRYIRERGSVPLRVQDILQELNVTRRYLERRFRKVLNRGIWEEIRRVHLDLSRRLLAETKLPMAAVAARSGFFSAKQFSQAFRQETGCSPTEYRQRFRSPAGPALVRA